MAQWLLQHGILLMSKSCSDSIPGAVAKCPDIFPFGQQEDAHRRQTGGPECGRVGGCQAGCWDGAGGGGANIGTVVTWSLLHRLDTAEPGTHNLDTLPHRDLDLLHGNGSQDDCDGWDSQGKQILHNIRHKLLKQCKNSLKYL